MVPSSKRLHNYWKSPFLLGKLTISMAIFNSYVSHYQSVNDGTHCTFHGDSRLVIVIIDISHEFHKTSPKTHCKTADLGHEKSAKNHIHMGSAADLQHPIISPSKSHSHGMSNGNIPNFWYLDGIHIIYLCIREISNFWSIFVLDVCAPIHI